MRRAVFSIFALAALGALSFAIWSGVDKSRRADAFDAVAGAYTLRGCVANRPELEAQVTQLHHIDFTWAQSAEMVSSWKIFCRHAN